LRGTSTEFVRSAAALLHLPLANRDPDLVFSAVLRHASPGATPVLSLYEGCRAIVRTLSNETLLQSFLSELRGRALSSAGDRLYLKSPAVRAGEHGLVLPPSAARGLVRFERASLRAGIQITSIPAVVLDLKKGRPVHEFAPSSNGAESSTTDTLDAIAVFPKSDGGLPTRAEVLFELAQHAPNLRSVGESGLEALGAFVESAELVEWDEGRPTKALAHLAGRLTVS
jgi:hypothetical protein